MGQTKYSLIADELRAAIDAGDLVPGEQLPTRARLADIYRCTTLTVRAGLLVLAQEGRIRMGQGKRATVLPPPYLAARAAALFGAPVVTPRPPMLPGPGDLAQQMRKLSRECDRLLALAEDLDRRIDPAELLHLNRDVVMVNSIVTALAAEPRQSAAPPKG